MHPTLLLQTNRRRRHMPILIWAIPAIVVIGGGMYAIVHVMH